MIQQIVVILVRSTNDVLIACAAEDIVIGVYRGQLGAVFHEIFYLLQGILRELFTVPPRMHFHVKAGLNSETKYSQISKSH